MIPRYVYYFKKKKRKKESFTETLIFSLETYKTRKRIVAVPHLCIMFIFQFYKQLGISDTLLLLCTNIIKTLFKYVQG